MFCALCPRSSSSSVSPISEFANFRYLRSLFRGSAWHFGFVRRIRWPPPLSIISVALLTLWSVMSAVGPALTLCRSEMLVLGQLEPQQCVWRARFLLSDVFLLTKGLWQRGSFTVVLSSDCCRALQSFLLSGFRWFKATVLCFRCLPPVQHQNRRQ